MGAYGMMALAVFESLTNLVRRVIQSACFMAFVPS